jgi:predicted MarR family transcription regulator
MGSDPLKRNWLEIRILNRLNDRGHAIGLQDLRDNLVQDMRETIVLAIFKMQKEGLLNTFEVQGGKMVDITEGGKTALADIQAAGKGSDNGI